MTTIPRIAIIGAGPAGLTLARLLHISSIKVGVTVYELDACRTSREGQSGTLDLHHDTGLAAIHKCGLWDKFQKYARYEGQEAKMLDKNAAVYLHMKQNPKEGENIRPEIDRHELRDMLLDSVPSDWIKWDRHLKEVTTDGKLRFKGREDQLEGPFDLIVGADGAWSKVRARLNGDKPQYSGVTGYEVDILKPIVKCPHVDAMVGQGVFFGPSDNKLLNAQRMGNGSIKVRTWFQSPEGEAEKKLKEHGKKAMLDVLLEKYRGWAPEMTELLKQGDLETLRTWTLYELPVGSQWEHQQGYTLIGDAASLSTPFSGEGVNKAMRDSLDLADLLEKSQSCDSKLSLDQAVRSYEESMFPRAKKLQTDTMANKRVMMTQDSPVELISHLIRWKASESKSRLVRLGASSPFIAILSAYLWTVKQIGWFTRTFWRRT